MYILIICLIATSLTLPFGTFTPPLLGNVQARQVAPVEIEGWDISSLDDKVAESAGKAMGASASQRDKADAAAAYLRRANFFYGAARPILYKLAVGDFRRVLRFQPDNEEAREKLEQIVSIYQSMERPVPENGNEGDVYNDPNARYKLRPQLIKFSSGEETINLSETLPLGLAYVYEVSGGQQIHVKLKANDKGAVFTVYKEHLDDASRIIAEATDWNGAASGEGNYLIKVVPKKDAAIFRLTVSAK